MGILSDRDIKLILNNKSLRHDDRLEITARGSPISDEQVGECSIDLHLSSELRRLRRPFHIMDFFQTWVGSVFRLFMSEPVFDLASVKEKDIDKWITPVQVMDSSGGTIVRTGELVLAVTEEFVRLPGDTAGFLTGRQSYARLGLQVDLSASLMVAGHYGKIPLQIWNNSPTPIRLYPGIRICQLVLWKLDSPSSKPYYSQPGASQWAETQPQASRFYQDPEIEALSAGKPQFVWPEMRANLGFILLFLTFVAAIVIGVLNLIY